MIGDFERLLAVVRLRDQQLIDVHPQFLGISAVERMFGIDKRGNAARLLRLGDRMDRKGRFTRRFGTVDFDHAAFRITADTERLVECNRT